MIILGIETSCDETAAAVIKVEKNDKIKILSNIVSSQIDIHKKYGGIVPEVAAREHVLNIIPVINEALEKARLTPQPPLLIRRGKGAKRQRRGIDAIAVTIGPGLITSLQVGVETAKTLSYAWNMPIIGVNHIEGHIYANFIGNSKISAKGGSASGGKTQNSKLFPAVVLTVSGGHTKLILMEGHGKYKTIGETRDDAAGEAFDKAAKLMGLEYPGGPVIAAEAKKFKIKIKKLRIELPRPMIKNKSFDFSFSGLKTALLYQIQKDKNWKKKIPEYCHEYQQAIIDVLIHKTIKAAQKYNAKSIMLTGGVSANSALRAQLKKEVKKQLPDVFVLMPNFEYTTDNATVIAAAGYYKAKRKEFTPWEKIKTNCNLEI